jgi:hypothetical protein
MYEFVSPRVRKTLDSHATLLGSQVALTSFSSLTALSVRTSIQMDPEGSHILLSVYWGSVS